MKQQENTPSKENKEFVKSLSILGAISPPQPATVEEAAKARYPMYSENLDLPKHFDADNIAEAEQKAFVDGYSSAHQSNPINERHWEMEPLEPEPMGGKSLQECKDIIANSRDYVKWEGSDYATDGMIDELCELYAQQMIKQDRERVKAELKNRNYMLAGVVIDNMPITLT